MNRADMVRSIRQKLAAGEASIGSWMQIASGSIAEILGQSGYDWVAVDLEHGSISTHQLPDLFRALELGGTLPMARLIEGTTANCKLALDAGAGGVIVPMVEDGQDLARIRDACCWPPAGRRGVGFSRANLFGEHFETYRTEAQSPLLVAMIESVAGVQALSDILAVEGLDTVLIGPYDLSASLGMTAQFADPSFTKAVDEIRSACDAARIAVGIHVVTPDPAELAERIGDGYRFVAYGIDAVFLRVCGRRP